MATNKEMELAKQILEMLNAMDDRLDRIDDSLGKINDELSDRGTSLASEVADLQNVNKGIQAVFEQGFADVHKGLAEIKEVKQIKKNGKLSH
ncbi:chromosome segregation protein SMC [Bacillus cereus]|uniref:chromosome segregation protein SMC n=1 Tax=Bacillus cereus TaxID=1396 RepID=UPI0027DE9955|nr:chromosome segregation protein SMC [Bacillus cereus]MDQ4485741.1 chromosome segregation protein SMC [Bacillus cereus]